MMRRRLLPFLAGVFLASAGFAQSDFDGRVVNLALIRIPAVAKEVKIAPDQTKKMAVVEKESYTALEKLRLGKTPPTTQQLQASAKATKVKMLAIFSPSQLKRLREITIQTMGPLGVMNPDVQAKLAISKVQKSKLSKLLQSFAPKLAAAAQSKDPKAKPTDADLKKRRAAIDKIHKELAVEVRKVLTAEQLKQYRTLAGKPCPNLQLAARVPL